MNEKIIEQPQPVMTRLLRASEVASTLNISRSFAYQLLETGQMPTVRMGHALRVRVQDLEAYIEAHLVQDGKSN